MIKEELWLRANAIPGFGARKITDIVTALEYANIHLTDLTPKNSDPLYDLGLSSQQIERFWQLDNHYLQQSLDWLLAPNHTLLVFNDRQYPNQLRHIGSPPTLLFVAGDCTLLSQPQLAIVGSRRLSRYGEHWSHYFSAELSYAGLVITSGLALGIDGIAHQAALNSTGKTIAVLGSGLANIYPKTHTALALDIVNHGGAIVSEFLSTALPLAEHFPRRNRIISGLSRGVFVVEATKNSGSLITAKFALEQGRDVFALPSALGSPLSEGTHWLIQQGAYLVTHPNDILEQIDSGLRWLMLETDTGSSQAKTWPTKQSTRLLPAQKNNTQHQDKEPKRDDTTSTLAVIHHDAMSTYCYKNPRRHLNHLFPKSLSECTRISPTATSKSIGYRLQTDQHKTGQYKTDRQKTMTTNLTEADLSDLAREILYAIDDHMTPIDLIAERSGHDISTTTMQLLELELSGYIAQVSGGFIRLRRL